MKLSHFILMNILDFWSNGSIYHPVVLYNAHNFIIQNFLNSVLKINSHLIIIYNYYNDINEKLNLIREVNFPHYFSTQKRGDTGIIILSKIPIIIHTNKKLPLNSSRICRKLIFIIGLYQLKITLDNEMAEDGYHFYLKYFPTTRKISFYSKKLEKSIILKSRV
jgi:hypothetical protein